MKVEAASDDSQAVKNKLNGFQQLLGDHLNKQIRKINNTTTMLLQILGLSPHPIITVMVGIVIATSDKTASVANNIEKKCNPSGKDSAHGEIEARQSNSRFHWTGTKKCS